MVFKQDYKDRQVYWFLFPLIAILSGVLFYENTLPELFLVALASNLSFVITLIVIIYGYAKLKLNMKLLNTIGIGDLFLFIALSVSFSTISFIVIFIGALTSSLILHKILSKKQISTTVPLAGYMSLFFLMTYIIHWSGKVSNLYAF